MNWKEHIISDPAILFGKMVIKGTRIPVSVVIDNLAAGVSHAEIFGSYPALNEADLEAALRYAAALARESTFELPSLESVV